MTMMILRAFSGREIMSHSELLPLPFLPLQAAPDADAADAPGSAKKGSVISTSGVGGSMAAPPPFECASCDWWSIIMERSVPRRRWSHCAIVSLPTPGKPFIQTSAPGGPRSPGESGGAGAALVVWLGREEEEAAVDVEVIEERVEVRRRKGGG